MSDDRPITFESDDRQIIVLVGPSGTGKSTLANIISAGSGIHRVRSYTDRPSRKDETIEDYHFVNSDRMNSIIAHNSLFAIREHKQADGSTFRYGFKKSDFEDQAEGFHAYICIADLEGLEDLKKEYGSRVLPYWLTVPDRDERILRLIRRGDSTESIKTRLASDSKQFKSYSQWDLARPGSLFASNKIVNGGPTLRILSE